MKPVLFGRSRWHVRAAVLFGLLSCGSVQAGLPTVEELQRIAPAADGEVLRRALDAMQCASSQPGGRSHLLSVIDYSKPSREKRLWVFDLDKRQLLFEEWVAHGKNSGGDVPTAFSNRVNSHQSSLGLYRTGPTYHGRHGRSLRLFGLEPGFNDNSRERAIVMHSAAYADPKVVTQLGRLGRSLGCPALRPAIAQKLIDTVKDGSYLFAYYPQQEWLKRSEFLAGASCSVAGSVRSSDIRAVAQR